MIILNVQNITSEYVCLVLSFVFWWVGERGISNWRLESHLWEIKIEKDVFTVKF